MCEQFIAHRIYRNSSFFRNRLNECESIGSESTWSCLSPSWVEKKAQAHWVFLKFSWNCFISRVLAPQINSPVWRKFGRYIFMMCGPFFQHKKDINFRVENFGIFKLEFENGHSSDKIRISTCFGRRSVVWLIANWGADSVLLNCCCRSGHSCHVFGDNFFLFAKM